jgi:phage shock protein A
VAQQQEREDAELNRDIEAMDQRYREMRAKKELAKASETETRRRPK